MGSADVNMVEDQIRMTALTKRIRLNEFFIDFDHRRSGFVTWSQFFRVLWENLGVRLGEDEERTLASKYDVKGDGATVNWRHFCQTLLPKFDVANLNDDPLCQTIAAKELLGTSRTIRPLSPDTEEHMERLLRRLACFYKQRGISLRDTCADIDKHNMGFISESQFFRFCPRPGQLSEDDITKLVFKYRVPNLPGFINFFNLSNDLDALAADMDAKLAPSAPHTRATKGFLPHHMPTDRSLQELLDHLRVTVFRSQIRSTDFFRDYDPLRCGLITDNQFGNALVLAVGKEAKLTEGDVQKVVEFYRAPDGRIHYKEFCDMLENAFNVPDLDKKPTQEVTRPGRGALGRNLPILTEWEEERVAAVLDLLRDQVVQRRIMVYPYFKDYDRSMAYSRVITPTQFGRVLSILNLLVPYNDFQLLCRKFADPVTGDINYPGFVQTIDKQFVNYTQDTVKEYDKDLNPAVECDYKPDEVVDLDHLIPRIRHIVLVNRIRIKEFFEDYDLCAPDWSANIAATINATKYLPNKMK